MREFTNPKRALATLLCMAAVWTGLSCATNPATGERQLSLISEEGEIQLGRQSNEEVIAAFGLYENEALERYVAGVGQRLASRSERPDLPWKFQILDDPAVNAMALPGGFVYVTRGILAHLGSEAELAGVLGHEIGHVTARHSVNQMSKQQLLGGLVAVGSAVSPEVARFGDLAGQGLGLLFLKFGRDDERQADDLGLRYMLRGGYDPRQMPGMFEMLQRVSGLSEGGRVPTWLSTHPNPEARGRRAEEAVADLTPEQRAGRVARQEYLHSVDGIVFGSDPRNGYFDGDRFLHPQLAFGLDFPPGWDRENQTSRVVAVGPQQDVLFELTVAEEGSPESARDEFLGQEGLTAGRTWNRPVHSLPAAGGRFSATSGTQELEGTVTFVELGGRLYRLLGYGLAASYEQHGESLEQSVGSFHRVTNPEVLSVSPDRMELTEVSRSMTLQEFQQVRPSVIDLDHLAVLNRIDPGETVAAGEQVKRVVGKRPRPSESR